MIKNLFENAKIQAAKVMTQKPLIESFPPFEALGQRQSVQLKDLWQYSIEDLCGIISRQEEYINKVAKNYNNLSEEMQPMFSKFEMLEKERKRLSVEIQEKEDLCRQLESAMVEMQADCENELRKKEILVVENEQIKKEIQSLQSQIEWNNHMDEQEAKDFDQALLELDKSQDEQFKYRIETLTNEVQEQITLNQQSIAKIQGQQTDIDRLTHENKQLNRNLNMTLQQLADIQTKIRQENEQKRLEMNHLQTVNGQLIQQIEDLKNKQQSTVNLEIENSKLKEQIQKQQLQIQELQQQLENTKELETRIKQQDNLILILKNKRDLAISEIASLSKTDTTQNYSISISRLKQIKFEILSRLIHTRKDFEQMYKQYLSLVCQVEQEQLQKELVKLEKNINGIVQNMQDLVDEIEDVMT